MKRGGGICLVVAVLLSGCSVIQDKPVNTYDLAVMQHLQQQKNWSFEGRLSLVDDKESVSVSILWRHVDGQDDIELVGPLAQGRVKISVAATQVVVDDGENRNVFQGDADDVVAEQLGRRWLGCDLSAEYNSWAADRLRHVPSRSEEQWIQLDRANAKRRESIR